MWAPRAGLSEESSSALGGTHPSPWWRSLCWVNKSLVASGLTLSSKPAALMLGGERRGSRRKEERMFWKLVAPSL